MHVSNNIASKYFKICEGKIDRLKEEIDKFTTTVNDFYIPLSAMQRTSGKKKSMRIQDFKKYNLKNDLSYKTPYAAITQNTTICGEIK